MNSCENIIYVQHECAQVLFEEARHPDLEALAKRDTFLEKIRREYAIRMEGHDVVMEVPDVEIDTVPNFIDSYVAVTSYCPTDLNSVGFSSRHSEPYKVSMRPIAA